MEIGNSFLVNHFNSTAWLLRKSKLEIISNILANKLNNVSLPLGTREEPTEPCVERLDNGIAVLNIEGTLLPKVAALDSLSGLTSTKELNNSFNKLVADESVSRIILHVHSEGGAVTGIPEFANDIYEARSVKEIVSYVDVMACSGGYYLASAAEKLKVCPTAELGSIGAYIALLKQVETEGTKTHIIQAGSQKVYGATSVAITEDEESFFQARINHIYDFFTADISKFRGVSQEEVKSTKGGFYMSSEASEWMHDGYAKPEFLLT